MNYLLHILISINLYVMLALSLNLLVGYTGLLSLCHAVFYGVGAYACALLTVGLGLPYLLALPLAFAAGVLASLCISLPTARLKGDYFVLATLGFQVVFFTVLYNWRDVTNGPYGIAQIPRPGLGGYVVTSNFGYWLFCTAVCGLTVAALRRLGRTPFGAVLKAIREEEVAATTLLSQEVPAYKVLAFAIAGGFAALAGALLAGYTSYIDPTSFTLAESIFILSIIIIGGAGNVTGPVAGAVLLVCLPEALRYLSVPDGVAAPVRQIIYGLLILFIMRFQPRGILGEYRYQ